MNWVQISLSNTETKVEYLVTCDPNRVYKPFETGLLILIILCLGIVTLSSLFSRAWSYQGYGIPITIYFLVVFNGLVIVGSVLAYYFPVFMEDFINVVATVLGIIGVMVCTSETLWLFKIRKLNEPYRQ